MVGIMCGQNRFLLKNEEVEIMGGLIKSMNHEMVINSGITILEILPTTINITV